MGINVADIKKLRDSTALGMNDCRQALEETSGDFNKALEVLKRKGAQIMAKREGKQTSQGIIDAYLHFGGNLGALVEVNCETDFVARTDVFKKFVKDVAMQVAAVNPIYLKREDIALEEINKIENIEEYVKINCLLEQPFVKDSKITMNDYLKDVISQTGEKIVIRRFSRFALGE